MKTTREELLYKLTGTENPHRITQRESAMIDKFLELLNEEEQPKGYTELYTNAYLAPYSTDIMFSKTHATSYDAAMNRKGNLDNRYFLSPVRVLIPTKEYDEMTEREWRRNGGKHEEELINPS